MGSTWKESADRLGTELAAANNEIKRLDALVFDRDAQIFLLQRDVLKLSESTGATNISTGGNTTVNNTPTRILSPGNDPGTSSDSAATSALVAGVEVARENVAALGTNVMRWVHLAFMAVAGLGLFAWLFTRKGKA